MHDVFSWEVLFLEWGIRLRVLRCRTVRFGHRNDQLHGLFYWKILDQYWSGSFDQLFIVRRWVVRLGDGLHQLYGLCREHFPVYNRRVELHELCVRDVLHGHRVDNVGVVLVDDNHFLCGRHLRNFGCIALHELRGGAVRLGGGFDQLFIVRRWFVRLVDGLHQLCGLCREHFPVYNRRVELHELCVRDVLHGHRVDNVGVVLVDDRCDDDVSRKRPGYLPT
jgi:hypothetical protein